MVGAIIYLPEECKDFGFKTKGSVGFDICAKEETVINPKELKLVSTGVRLKILKEDIFAAVFLRSSLPIKKSLILANSVGIIDKDYCGKEDEIKLALYNFGDEKVRIEKGERIAQIVFLKFEKPEIKVTRDLDCFEDLSRGGFGSTG